MPSILNQSFRPEEYSVATLGLNVKAVYMEVDVVPEEAIGEATRILELAGSGTSATVAAIIGGRVGSPAFAKYLGKFASCLLMKGVRQVLHLQDPGYCLQELFVHNVKLLGEQGKSFDLCMRPTDLNDGVKLVTQCPDTRFVLDHCGCPDLKSFRKLRAGETEPSHTADEWKRSIQAFAKFPNVIIKISGVIENLSDGADASDLAPAVTHCLESFGPDRVVFGSNWPVCLLGGPFKQWVEFLSQIIGGTPEADQRKLWFENAIKFYSLQV